MIQKPDPKPQFTAVSGRTHVFRRENGAFYFRRTVPVPLRKILDKTEYRISLRTKIFKEAARDLPAQSLFVDREFARAEAELAGEKLRETPISDEELRWMVSKTFVELETRSFIADQNLLKTMEPEDRATVIENRQVDYMVLAGSPDFSREDHGQASLMHNFAVGVNLKKSI